MQIFFMRESSFRVRFLRPYGARDYFSFTPTAYAVCFILAALRAWDAVILTVVFITALPA
jgi:hypothetical protein